MPPRANAIATCSCGAKWGDSRRAERGDFQLGDDAGTLAERLIITSKVPEMIRHYRLGHSLTGHGRQWMEVIARAANEIAIREGARP